MDVPRIASVKSQAVDKIVSVKDKTVSKVASAKVQAVEKIVSVKDKTASMITSGDDPILSPEIISKTIINGITHVDVDKIVSAKNQAVESVTLTNEQVCLGCVDSIFEEDALNLVDIDAYQRRINKIVGQIDSFRNGGYNVKVYISEEINAHAWPDGSIRVYSGLMNF